MGGLRQEDPKFQAGKTLSPKNQRIERKGKNELATFSSPEVPGAFATCQLKTLCVLRLTPNTERTSGLPLCRNAKSLQLYWELSSPEGIIRASGYNYCSMVKFLSVFFFFFP